MHRLILAAALLPIFPPSLHAPSAPVIEGCPDHGPELMAAAAPRGSGPLVLARIDCPGLPGSPFTETPPAPSPDGRQIFTYNGIEGLRIAALVPGTPLRRPAGRISGSFDPPPFKWDRESRTIWGVRQEVVVPNGWALAPLEPTIFPIEGAPRQLPALTHPAGGLDALYWAGDRGKALAAFGTRGGYYRPEREDKHPTLALVDAGKGTVLQSVAFADLPGPARSPAFFGVATGVDGAGRIHVLLSLAAGRWLWWREGEAPRFVPIDAPGGPHASQIPFALTPDLGQVLVMHSLSASGVICEHNPRCPPPVPTTGTIADLREIETGRVLWSITGTARNFSRSLAPAISPDGRHALITVPADAEPESVALISMADGRILQLLPPGTPGFFPDGSIWISRGSQIARYRFQ